MARPAPRPDRAPGAVDRRLADHLLLRWAQQSAPGEESVATAEPVRIVPPQPYLRVDTNDYSLDPRLVGRRVEIVVSQRRVRGRALGGEEIACDHERLFARHRTVTALEHARALQALRGDPAEVEVERRPLARYDRLIPA